jgi:predicted glycoside hydrolase/deacetylase ChbG (UPF0249 family)
MANAKYFNDALENVIVRYPDLKIGLHVNLTYGRPISRKPIIPLLANKEGKFKHSFVSLVRIKKSDELQRQIYQEIKAQIEKAIRFGIKLNHIDSHEHIHIIPFINKILKELAAKYEIMRIREFNESMLTTIKISRSILILLNINTAKFLLLKILNTKNNTNRDLYFFSILLTGKIKREHIKRLRNGKYEPKEIEVMVHPGDKNIDKSSIIENNRVRKWLHSKNRKRELYSILK